MPGIQSRKESVMKTYALTKPVKDELTKLALTATAAYGAVARTKNPKFSVSAEELVKLNQTKQETAESLKQAVSKLALNAVKELAGWIQYKASHDPIKPAGKGLNTWDKVTANQLSGALWSIVNALKAEHGDQDDRVRQASNRANSTMLFVKGCNETGICPRNGMTSDSRDFLLRELDRRFQGASAEGNTERAKYLNELYAQIQKSLAFLKPRDSAEGAELPVGVTVNADTTGGIATMGETLQPVAEASASVAAAKPAVAVVAGKKPRFQGRKRNQK